MELKILELRIKQNIAKTFSTGFIIKDETVETTEQRLE